MKIRNKLYISAGISIILVVILFSVMLMTSRRISEKNKEQVLSRNLQVAISELGIITYEYLMHREKRMEKQWTLRYNSAAKILRKAEKDKIESLRADFSDFGRFFLQVTKNYKKTQNLIQIGASQEKIDITIALEEKYVTQMLITSQSIITDTSRLAEKTHVEATEAQKLVRNLVLILMIIFDIVVTTTSLLVARVISKPLDKLTKGTEIIGKGDLEYKIDIKSRDEIGELSTAFNQMTENLKKVTASRDELNKEIIERKLAEEALKEANQQLRASEQQLKAANQQLRASEEELRHHREHLEELVEERTRELRDAHELLVVSEKLAAIGQLASGVGHELRNPLGVIGNSAYYLNTKLKDADEKVIKHVGILKREVGRANRIITDLLDFSRVRPPSLEESDVNGIIKETLAEIEVPENISVETELDGKLPKILVDTDQTRQVFVNIISNALDVMPEGGKLDIETGVSGDFVEIMLRDTGEGIPEENLQKIFKPLFTTKARGIGLGLAIVKGIIDSHKGKIEAKSQAGKGAVFTVKLLLKEEEGG